MTQHCKSCRCQDGQWTVEVRRLGATTSGKFATRDEAVLWAADVVTRFAPVDWFHQSAVTVTFGGGRV